MIIAAIEDPPVIAKILAHLNLPSRGKSNCSKRPDRTLTYIPHFTRRI